MFVHEVGRPGINRAGLMMVLTRLCARSLATGGVFFPLPSLARLLKMLMLANIRKNARLLTLLLEAPKSALEGLAILDANPRQ